MRHAPYPIDLAARNAWMEHMLGALEDAAIPESERALMREYFEKASLFLINRD
jgi:hemoglobin